MQGETEQRDGTGSAAGQCVPWTVLPGRATATLAGGPHHHCKMKCVLNRLLAASQMLVEPSGEW